MHPPIVVISERNSAFRQRVEVNGMDDLFADVPTVVGGDESAPDPPTNPCCSPVIPSTDLILAPEAN